MSATSARVILSAKVIWAAAEDDEVTEKERNASMMAKKSRVEMVICYGGDAEVLGLITFVGAVVLGAEGFGGAEEAGVVGDGVVVAGARTEDAGT